MYRLYLNMKNRTDPPTEEELAIASGEKGMDAEAANLYLGKVEVASSANLLSMFAKQSQDNAVSEILYSPLLISYIDYITRKRRSMQRPSRNT
jgi:hypothetical protein